MTGNPTAQRGRGIARPSEVSLLRSELARALETGNRLRAKLAAREKLLSDVAAVLAESGRPDLADLIRVERRRLSPAGRAPEPSITSPDKPRKKPQK